MFCLLCLVAAIGCSGKHPVARGTSQAGLAPCPASPNCVSSDASDPGHRVDAFALAAPAEVAWPAVRAALDGLPRTTVVELTPSRLRAECRSALFRFVDDLELQLRASNGVIAVRSASRVGHSDLGANRRRVERLRELLRERGVVR